MKTPKQTPLIAILGLHVLATILATVQVLLCIGVLTLILGHKPEPEVLGIIALVLVFYQRPAKAIGDWVKKREQEGEEDGD